MSVFDLSNLSDDDLLNAWDAADKMGEPSFAAEFLYEFLQRNQHMQEGAAPVIRDNAPGCLPAFFRWLFHIQ